MKFPYKKILIIGNGGVGKSTLASTMGKYFSLPVVHLDKIWWLPNWKTRSTEQFDALLCEELKKFSWIIEGNYKRTFSERLKYADFCIFLDYSTRLCLKSARKRANFYKGKTRPDMTEGCTERIDPEFENWIIQFKKEVKPKMLDELKNSKVPYKIFKTRKAAKKWLSLYDKTIFLP